MAARGRLTGNFQVGGDIQYLPRRRRSAPSAGATTGSAAAWSVVRLGGGGFVSGIDSAADGTMVARTDTASAYVLSNPTWVPLFTKQSLPAAYAWELYGSGVYEIRVAPSNSSYMYATIQGGVTLLSTNRGATWTYSGIAADSTADPNAGNGIRGMTYKIGIDPNNPLIAIVSTPAAINRTTNGGASWTSIASSFAAHTAGYGNLVAWHPTNSSIVYVGVYGVGVYRSADGGATWGAVMASSPTTQISLRVDQDGYVYVAYDPTANGVGSTTTVYVYNGTSWVTSTVAQSNGVQCLVPDPATAGRVVLYDLNGGVNASADHGTTWLGNYTQTIAGTDVPWLTYTNGGLANASLYGSCAVFRRGMTNELWAGTGLGVVKCNPPVVTSGGGGAGSTSFDPAFSNGAHTLSNGNLKVTGTGVTGVSRTIASVTSGKYYWEYTVGQASNLNVGICSSTEPNNTYITSDQHSLGTQGSLTSWQQTSGLTGTTTAPQGNIVGHTYGTALDATNRKIWLKDITAASNWNANAGDNPATGAGGANFSVQTDVGSAALYVGVTCGAVGDNVTYNFGATAYAGTPPAGFVNLPPTVVADVQSVFAPNGNSNPINIAAGNLVVIVITGYSLASQQTASSTHLGAFTNAGFLASAGQVLYAYNTGGALTNEVITLSQSIPSWHVYSISGAAASSPIEAPVFTNGGATGPFQVSITTTKANDLLFANGIGTGLTGPEAGWTAAPAGSTAYGELNEYKSVSSTGTYTAWSGQNCTGGGYSSFVFAVKGA